MGELQSLFKESGCTLTEISKLSGVSLSTTYKYINGQVKNPNPDYYEPIYKVLSGIHTEDDETEEEIEEEIIEEIEAIAKKEIDSEKKKVIKESMQRIIDVQASDSEYSDEIGIDPNKIKAAIEGNAFRPTATPVKVNRGEIWYVRNQINTGAEIAGNRPFCVLSGTKVNQTTSTAMGVYLTKTPKSESPFHVTIKTNVMSTVLCEQLSCVSKERFSTKVGNVSEIEIALIEKAVLNALDIKVNPVSDMYHSQDYLKIRIERDLYKQFYEDVISAITHKSISTM